VRILAYRTSTSEGKVLLEESTGMKAHSNNLDTLFSFLLEQQGNSPWPPQYDRCIRVCWSLDVTVSLLLRLLGENRCIRLHQTHKCYIAPFNCFYVPGKIFSVTHIPTKDRVSLYDLQQYFPELNEPEDLLEVQMLGEKLLYELRKMGLEPDKLTSPVAIYEQCVISNLDLPKVADMPKEAAEAAYQTSGRLWIEAFTLGHFEQVYDYDLISSFPSVARDLIDIRYCDWVKSKSKLNRRKAIYGYAKCIVTIYDWVMVSPILHREEDGNLISFTGTCEEYLIKEELDFIDKWKIGEYKILEGWWAIPR